MNQTPRAIHLSPECNYEISVLAGAKTLYVQAHTARTHFLVEQMLEFRANDPAVIRFERFGDIEEEYAARIVDRAFRKKLGALTTEEMDAICGFSSEAREQLQALMNAKPPAALHADTEVFLVEFTLV